MCVYRYSGAYESIENTATEKSINDLVVNTVD